MPHQSAVFNLDTDNLESRASLESSQVCDLLSASQTPDAIIPTIPDICGAIEVLRAIQEFWNEDIGARVALSPDAQLLDSDESIHSALNRVLGKK